MFMIDQYVGGGQVRAFISGGGGGGMEGPQAGGDGIKKVTLCLVSCVVEKGEHVDK